MAKVWYGPINAAPWWQRCSVSLLEQFQAQLIESLALGWCESSSCPKCLPVFGLMLSSFCSNWGYFLIECLKNAAVCHWKQDKLQRHQQLDDCSSFIEYLAWCCANWSIIRTLFLSTVRYTALSPRRTTPCSLFLPWIPNPVSLKLTSLSPWAH